MILRLCHSSSVHWRDHVFSAVKDAGSFHRVGYNRKGAALAAWLGQQ